MGENIGETEEGKEAARVATISIYNKCENVRNKKQRIIKLQMVRLSTRCRLIFGYVGIFCIMFSSSTDA